MTYLKQIILVSLFTILLFQAAGTSDVFAQTGEELYSQKCGRCHVAYAPEMFSADEWPGIVRSMAPHAALTKAQTEEIIKYVVAGSESGHSLGGATYGGYLYTEYFKSAEQTKNFDLHYLAFSASGWANEKLYYFGEFELEHGGTNDHTFVEQAYMDYWFTNNFAVKVGMMLTPFNRFDEFHDPLTNYTISRPQMSREIGASAWKEVGVSAHGFVNANENLSISYDTYLINGLGDGSRLRESRQYRDNNEDLAMGGRVNFTVMNQLELGGSVYTGAWDDAGELN